MAKDTVNRALTTARDLITTMKADADARGSRVASLGLEHLRRIVDDMYDDINNADLAETMLVYQLAAEEIAEIVSATPADTFAALVEYCADEELRPFLTGSPAPAAALMAALDERVRQLQVVYDGKASKMTREIRILHLTVPDHRPVRRTITHPLGWDDLPPGIRARMLAGPAGPVAYQLYPSAPAADQEGS